MPATSTNKGNQQVSVFYQQSIVSSYANELLYGIANYGVANARVTITNSSGILFTVKAGTTLYFKQQINDPNTDNSGQKINQIIKIVLNSDYAITAIAASDLWFADDTVSATTGNLYIVASWEYNTTNAIYASINVYSDQTLPGGLSGASFIGDTVSYVLIATINNHGLAKGASAGITTATYLGYNGGAYNIGNGINAYHISYEGQIGRDVHSKMNTKNDEFMVHFAYDGSGVYVGQGNSFLGDNFVSTEALYSLSSTAPVGELGKAYAPKIAPPAEVYTYITDYVTGATTTLASGFTNYYQIDFLRIKSDELTHTFGLSWETFIQPKGTFNLTFDPSGSTQTTQQEILNYLSTSNLGGPFPMFPLKGSGHTLMVSVRLLSNVIASNVIWPEGCVVFKSNEISELGVNAHSRFKLPVWQATDIGL
jgi:hypothetical protein